jgi:hypothetical protein
VDGCDWILYRRKNGDVYEGEPWVKEAQNNWLDITPHGKGTWRFADGTTLTGDKVAFDGLPHGSGVNQDGKEETWFAGEKREKKRRKM